MLGCVNLAIVHCNYKSLYYGRNMSMFNICRPIKWHETQESVLTSSLAIICILGKLQPSELIKYSY